MLSGYRKLFHQHLKTKSAHIPGFTAYDVTPINESTVTVTTCSGSYYYSCYHSSKINRTTAPRTFTSPHVTSPSASEESDDDDGPPVPPPATHAHFDMTDTNAPLTPRLPCELCNLETFYNPKQGDQGNIALLTQSHDEDEMFAYH
jgi:hypothetical protein